ncbi:transposase [Streptomyces sp. bgisy034]|uniref:transposase n=1 Tax=Streptomyces sp. bgisy034 TaxID=3413774 RepID=UPI003EBB3905
MDARCPVPAVGLGIDRFPGCWTGARPLPRRAVRNGKDSTRSGVEGTICEFANGLQARRSRYHGLHKTHVQHVLTGIAINLERLASRTPPRCRGPQHPTAFQRYLDSRGLTWECWWRQGK